jgi:hypothetical protein
MNENLKFLIFFFKFKRDNYVSYYQTMTEFELDQCIRMTYPYVKFELNMYNCWENKERKLKISDFFQT